MKIIIIGAGEVGTHLSGLLSGLDHDVVVIEESVERAQKIDEEFDVRVIQGNGSAASTLLRAGVPETDYLLAMTSDDQANLVACSLAKKLCEKITTVARVHDQTYGDNSLVNYQLHFGIDYLLNPEGLAAVELAKTIRNPGRVAVENFARGQIEVQQVRVGRDSKLAGRTLRELRLDPRLRIGFIQRGDQFELPTAETVLFKDDLLTVFGHPEAIFELRPKLESSEGQETIRVAIFGGTETAIGLVRMLSHPRFRIRIFEKNRDLCLLLAEAFPHITVIHGDATSLRLLEEEQIGGSDYFVACTKDDEDNIMTSMQASKLGAPHVLLLINKADYQEVLENLKSSIGVEQVVSPRLATANEVVRALSTQSFIELAALPAGKARLLEIRLGPKSPAAGRKVRDLNLPKGCVIVALLHKFQAKVPSAEDTLLAGDRVVATVPEDRVKDLLSTLA